MPPLTTPLSISSVSFLPLSVYLFVHLPSSQIPDYLSLDKLAGSVDSVLIIGGGFLGSELAVGLASRGEEEAGL